MIRVTSSGGQNCRQQDLQEVQDGLTLRAAILGCKLTPPISMMQERCVKCFFHTLLLMHDILLTQHVCVIEIGGVNFFFDH